MKLKRVVIKEELVALTGHYVQALILNQFIYWSERTKDFDQFIDEERKRDPDIVLNPTKGWVYKTAEDLSDELMLGMSVSTIRRYLGKLVTSGLLDERNNPKHKWDQTLQYRPNMVKIQTDLFHLGYALESYPLVVAISKMKNGVSKMKNQTPQNERAIPETTTESTSETPSADAENGAISKQSDKHNRLYQAGEVDEAIAKFVSVTGFTIPTAKRQLKLWQAGTKEHLAEEQFSGRLPELYRCVWDNIEDRVRAGELTITHPGAFTQYMYGIVQSENKLKGPISLDQLVSAGIVEVKTIDDKVGFFWPDGTLVDDITPALIEKHSHHKS